ncbi:hypothetical protein ACFQ1M_12885 [Sungkyunkwania multivorans]|uniref:Uncharacterized protein n=1 Tax=Sungkyunkwania multivorans TaxID=1173618 RepID=A0ABW3D2P8_9FLAO
MENDEYMEMMIGQNADYERMFEAFVMWQLNLAYGASEVSNWSVNQIQDAQHEIISGMVDDIANVIKSYGESKGYELDDFTYEALAWGGLGETYGFSFLDDEIQSAIDYINQFENNVNNQYEGSYEGSPCN